MDLTKTHKSLDAIRIVYQASPVCTLIHTVLFILQAVMPTAAMALATASFVDTAIAILNGGRPHNDIYIPLILLLFVLGAVTSLGAVIQLTGARINLNLQRKLKPAIVKINAKLDYKHIENAESWELISRVSREPEKSISDGFTAYMQLMQIIISIASVFMLIITQVWWAALVIITFSTPMLWLSMKAGKKNYQAGRDAEKFNRRTEYLNDVLTGRDAVDERTLFSYGTDVNDRWQKQFEAGRILRLKVSAKMFMITKGSSLILALIAILIALTLITPVILGDLSAGMFMGILSAVFGMVQFLGWLLSSSLENISKVGEYMKDIRAFVDLSAADDALTDADNEPIKFESLEFRDVSFRYPGGERMILDRLSFSLESGKHYAFVGKNGAGKTTITKLLTGLYNEYEGEIFINGKELRGYPTGAVKAMFSVVYQDFAKYYISLKENIVLGDIAGIVADDNVNDIVTQAGLDEVVAELKNGMDTPLGKILENGQDVSGGEWQRIAIARSLISRAPVKILDEPTASLDPISESRVYGDFEKLMLGKTTVFISHRLGSTKLADEILVIDDGQIIQRGTHDELMEGHGLYSDMFQAQRGWYQ